MNVDEPSANLFPVWMLHNNSQFSIVVNVYENIANIRAIKTVFEHILDSSCYFALFHPSNVLL